MNSMPINTYLIVVRVGAESVTDALGGRLLALGLDGRRSRVGLALELVAEVLSGRLLRVGLEMAYRQRSSCHSMTNINIVYLHGSGELV